MELKDRVVQYPGRVKMREVGSSVQKEYDLEPSEGVVTQEGTPLNAAALNSWADDVKIEALENSSVALETARNAEDTARLAKQDVQIAVSEIQATKSAVDEVISCYENAPAVTTSSDTVANVTIRRDPQNKRMEYHFTVPKGDTGATGPQGPQGLQGLKGDKGDRGDSGIVADINGLFMLKVNENGDLICVLPDAGENRFSFDPATGNLFYQF